MVTIVDRGTYSNVKHDPCFENVQGGCQSSSDATCYASACSRFMGVKWFPFELP
jgi:hypothetical protein